MRDMLSKQAVGLKPSGIRKFFDIVSEMDDAISLGVGEPDFDTPWHIRDEGIYSLEKGRTFYTSNSGLMELRQEICNYIKRKQGVTYDPQHEVLITVGGSEAIDIGLRAVVNPGDEVLIPQPSFVSYEPCAIMAGAVPVTIELKEENEFRLTAKELEDAITEKTKILILPFPNNPTGAIMERKDLEAIAEICHAHKALLLVDEAHGGHLYFHDRLPMGALRAGADVCVQSMHKVAGALTQSAVLHIKHHGVGEAALERIAQNLQLVQSTSPSYLLMTSLDCARYELARNGAGMMERALMLAEHAAERIRAIGGFRCMERDRTDRTRLVISAREIGLTGYALEKMLFEEYAVNMELADSENVLAIVTYANELEDMDRLVWACRDIGRRYGGNASSKTDRSSGAVPVREKSAYPPFPKLPRQIMTPRKAYFSDTETVRWQDAAGRTAGQMVAPYPPGIPVLYPGEEISQAVWDYIECFRRDKRRIHGADLDGETDQIRVVRRI